MDKQELLTTFAHNREVEDNKYRRKKTDKKNNKRKQASLHIYLKRWATGLKCRFYTEPHKKAVSSKFVKEHSKYKIGVEKIYHLYIVSKKKLWLSANYNLGEDIGSREGRWTRLIARNGNHEKLVQILPNTLIMTRKIHKLYSYWTVRRRLIDNNIRCRR